MNQLIYVLVTTHITIMCVTLFLHRGQAHKAVEFHPILEHFMRFWLWLTTGMVTKEWVAVHRKHHQASDTPADPHSPAIYGIWNILLKGVWYYKQASKDPEVMKLGIGTPDDWVERNVYTPYSARGILLMLAIDVVLFGWVGVIVWLVQMLWIPFWAAGFINGIGHWWGYRNTDAKDTSHNLWPLGLWIGGEELHNNHHADGSNACFRQRWFEIDIGWIYIKILSSIGLAKIRTLGTI